MDDQNTGPWSDYAAPAAPQQAASDGPWADYQKPSAPPATAPPPDKTNVPDASTVAGAGPAGIPQPAAHPAVDMKPSALSNPEPDRTVGQVAKDALWEGAGFGNVAKVAKTAYGAGKDLYQGTQATVGQTGEDFDKPKFIKGITQLVSGGSKTAIALSAPELMELGAAADAGHIGAQGAIIKILAAAEAGNIASDVGGAASDKLNLSPETKDLIQTAAFFLPTLAGAMKFKGGAGVDAQGNPGIGVSSKGGGFRAGAVGTPEAFDIRAQVGDTRVGVKIPRGGQPAPPPPDPAQVLQAQQTDAGTSAIIRAATKQKQAATVVAGGPPPPPPGPKLPAAMQDGVVSPQTVQDIATMIHLSPVEQHPKLIMEAHGKLAEYIQKQGRIIDPDGKLQIAETPQQAAKLAANIINNEVDRQQTAKEDAAKQQEQVAKEQEKAAKEANKPGEDGALSPADQQWARAKTIIGSTTLKPGQKIESVLQRNLGVGPGTANEMMQRYQKEQTEAALPTVGGKGHEVVEESRATVDAQIDAMKRGDTNVVMLPEGSKYRPKVPDGMKMIAVRGDAAGASLYIYNPQEIRASTIKEAAKAGTHGDLLGHIQPKSEIAAAPEKPTVVVQAQDKATGTPIQDSEVHPERVEQQKEVMAERHPDAKIVVKPTHEVLIDRLEAQHEESKADIVDEVGGEDHPANDYAKPAETAPAKEVAKSKEKETPVSESKKEPEAAGSQRGVAPAATERANEVAKPEVAKPAKGMRVAFKDREGIEREGIISHRSDRITRIGKYDVATSKVGEERPELKPGQVGRMAVSELHLDPKRFQYKVSVGANGVSDLLTGKKWNDNLAGVTSVWRDPADGKAYVVNGHHRATLAKQSKTANLPVRMLDAKDATEARSIGALQNIAEGRGTALDAAKFLRDTGITLEDLEEKGISMGEATAQNGVALSRLDTRLFDMVVHGKMGQGRGVAIGRETGDAATQDAIVKLIDKAEKRGQKVNDGTVEELARFAQTAPLRQETVASLFGTEDRTESTAIEKAEVSAFVKRQLSSEKRIFGAVSTEAKAKTLSAEGKNQIDAAGNAAKATSAEQALEVYDKLSARRGPIDDILNRAAEELSSGGAEVKQRAYEDIRAAVSDALGGSERASAGRHEEVADGSPNRADLEAAGQGGFFSRRKPSSVDSFALPGFEGDIEKQSESAKETTAQEQRQDVEHSLTTAKGDISKAAGKMERESPLFFGSDANEQKTLFSGTHSLKSDHLFTEAAERTIEENLDRAEYAAESTDGGRRYLRLNHDAFFAFCRALNVHAMWDGVTFNAEHTSRIVQALDLLSNGETKPQQFSRMRDAVSKARNEYQHLVLTSPDADDATLREENMHSWAVRFDLQDDVVREIYVNPLMERAARALKGFAYELDNPYTIVAEATAKAAADGAFMTLQDRRSLLRLYTDSLEKNGVDLAYVPAVLEDVRDVFGGKGDGQLFSGSPESESEGDVGRYSSLRSLPKSGGRSNPEGITGGGGQTEGRGQAAVSKPDNVEYLHGGLGIAAGALKPLANIKPVADVLAFLGDEADRVAVSRDLHNRLYDMASQDNAAVLRVVQMLKAMPGTAKDQQAIYHHLEDPKSVTLSKEQEEILDDYLTPLIYRAEHDFQVITEGGVPLDNYVHRQVRDRGGMIDRLMEKVRDKTPVKGIGGGRLTKTAPAQKHRTMMALQDVKTGKRQVVSIKGGRVTVMRNGQNPEDLGGLRTGMTSVGEEVDKRMMPFVERVTELRDEIAGAKDSDKVEQLADIQPRIAELKKQRDVLDGVTTKVGSRTPDLFQKGTAIRSSEVTFNQRAEITKKLDPLLRREEALKNGTAPMLLKNVSKLKRRKEELLDAEAARDHFLNELPPETFADKAWKDKNGGLHTITQATTKEIEANTNVRYYQNAAASVAVNYLAMDKARRAYEFLEDFKKSPEFAAASHSINSPGAIPKGWKATQLPQFRGYFFEPHIAEVLDAYAAKAAHDPSVLEKVGNFLRSSIFFNPLIHIPNLLNHWVVEKGVSGFANPLNYPTVTRAGIKAISAVIHQNKDFLEALDHGAPLQSQQFETKQFADLFFKRMQDELEDPDSSKAKELATALGMSPVNLIKAIYKFSGQATWYTNDIAFLQSTYEKQEKGMSLKDALTETAKHIPDYRLMTRIFDNPKLAKLMSNRNLTMFGAYHYGALKSYGQMAKSLTGFNWTDAGTKNEAGEPTNAAGRTEGEEKLHGLDTLAMMALVTFVAYPLLDKLWRAFTGNDKAQMRRAGASTLIYNLAMLAKGERTPVEVAESIATPAVQTKALAEMVLNRDLRTGQRLYDPHAPGKKLASQVGRQLLRSVAPVSQGMDIAEGRTDVKRLMYSMVGVSFPLHGAEKIAAQITAERLSSLPPRDEDEIAHAIQRSRALHDHWSGDNSKLIALLHGKDYTAKEKAKIRKDALLPPIVYAVRGMEYADAVRVYQAADSHERHQLKPLMSKKLATLIHEGKKPANAILGKDDDN